MASRRTWQQRKYLNDLPVRRHRILQVPGYSTTSPSAPGPSHIGRYWTIINRSVLWHFVVILLLWGALRSNLAPHSVNAAKTSRLPFQLSFSPGHVTYRQRELTLGLPIRWMRLSTDQFPNISKARRSDPWLASQYHQYHHNYYRHFKDRN